jgi:chromodomain-helicase-DNA-binding protein 4
MRTNPVLTLLIKFQLSAKQLADFDNGEDALQRFRDEPDMSPDSSEDFEAEEIVLNEDDEDEEEEESEQQEAVPPVRTRGVKRQRAAGFTDFSNVDLDDSEDELSMLKPNKRLRRGGRISAGPVKYSKDGDEEDDESDQPKTRQRRQAAAPVRTSARNTRTSTRGQEPEYIGLVDESSDDESEGSDNNGNLLRSDVVPSKRSRRDTGTRRRASRKDSDDFRHEAQGTRQSGRATRTQTNMKEVGEDDVFRSDSEREVRPVKPKVLHAKEVFRTLPGGNKFASRHCQQCDTCANGTGYGQLIHCQGCSLSYHKQCLGHRSSREHLVTKVGDDDFVLQCRRCVSFARRKETTAPDQGMCQTCREIGPACHPFCERKSSAQVERERAENDGEDPSTDVSDSLLNNPSNVLFRCMSCWRGWHYHHLPPKSDDVVDAYDDEEGLADQRHQQYKRDWSCLECDNMPAKISGLIAWRPIDQEVYVAGTTMDDMNEDDKQYLIKWEGKSYFRAQWMPGSWTWGVSAVAMRRAFSKRGTGLPTMNTEDAIPEDYLRIDIVLNVKFTSIVETRGEEIDKARIREVDEALIKFKGLGYEDAVWEKVPVPEEGDRWTDFVGAYDDWVMGRYVTIPKSGPLKNRLDKVRAKPFDELEKKKQPDYVTGGELMKYQVDGLNWLYYRWYQKKNAILADEMGLGKTIQIVSFLATLVQEHNCAPFLVVVPNSTCPNWRREIKRWAPSLRVVAYYGSAAARDAAYRYEMFPEGSKELKCHVVVTSYDAAADDNCRKFFKSVPWQGLIVDEGQRLKNDKNLLYEALTNMKIPFKVLLTGTPLQNNARELFNLLQFLDDSFNAAELELEYAELSKENVPALHQMIRPFFLRRTKAQVLTFMPPMAQIILPVSMSVLQTKLYSSILAKNPDLLRAIFETTSLLKKGDRGNLNNLLMQLRKCLCHPFVYSREIEERSELATVSHRNLVEASGKLQMLSLLLPKLQQRGHRVLIFSQFLDMLDIMEDFMDGLGLRHQRLDGTISALVKQKRIDEYNAKDSPLFAFLLSTRAGGVGINLATADTVIILDPDFNPHQDIQALSRAHRIGQKNKVLCFQLMTRASAEERIVQIGRKKMALDHILIERMDDDDDAGLDMESILRYGAAAILEGHTDEHRYDDAAIEKLLDRSQVEDTKAGEDNTAESQFSFARVWANDAASMIDSLPSDDEQEKAPDPSRWEYILKQREKVAAEEAAARQQALGRGKRVRKVCIQMAASKTSANVNRLLTTRLTLNKPATEPSETRVAIQTFKLKSTVNRESPTTRAMPMMLLWRPPIL